MKTITMFLLTLVVLGSISGACAAESATSRMLSHDVYFTLHDTSPAAKERLVAACKKYLADHPGVIWFDAGVRVPELQRDVNDQDFDVALHIVFQDKAAHDRYQTAPQHLQFIAENRDQWKKVRVFDAWLAASLHRAPPSKAEGSENP